ncbi:MAG: MarR family transcriptional regulator [Pseudomonadota bacterium]
MASPDLTRLRELFDRIGRVAAAEEWGEDLNPAQHGALAYLARANRFSRAPSNVADYLCTTRGTASQTLKALERKGFVRPVPSSEDKRRLSYNVTSKGRQALDAPRSFDAALGALSPAETSALADLLEATGRRLLERQGYRTFGVCRTCRYHQRTENGLACTLLKVPLTEADAGELCHEHLPPRPEVKNISA